MSKQINKNGTKRLNSYLNISKRGPPVFKPNDVFYSIVGVNKIDKIQVKFEILSTFFCFTN